MSTVPPSGASTRAAALARFNAKSTVIGCSPTRPRTPSVPKYLRVNASPSIPHGCDGLQRVHRRSDIVSAHDARAVHHRHHGERNAAVHARVSRLIENPAEHRLARQSNQHRPPHRAEHIELAQQRGIVRQSLAEAEARIDYDPLHRYAGGAATLHALLEECVD